jgi:hypothetical protein
VLENPCNPGLLAEGSEFELPVRAVTVMGEVPVSLGDRVGWRVPVLVDKMSSN